MDETSRTPDDRDEAADDRDLRPLDPAELRMIAEARLDEIAEFAGSPRLHAVDPDGNTPLHIAARMGNFALCDLFIRSGADPRAKNRDRRSPADVAFAGGHVFAVRRLFPFVDDSLDENPTASADARPEREADASERAAQPETFRSAPTEPKDDRIALDEILSFDPGEDEEFFFDRSAGASVWGAFATLETGEFADAPDADVYWQTDLSADFDWEIDLSPSQIAEGDVGFEAAVAPDRISDDDFLKVRKGGRRAIKPAVLPSSTRLSIDPERCLDWATEILARRYVFSEDVDALISFCEGNGDPDELRFNLRRTLETAGFELFDESNDDEDALWEARSDVSADDLAEALEAACSRATRLPGTSRFKVADRAAEERLLAPMLRAKRNLLSGMLACEPAVEAMLDVVERLVDGSVEPGFVTMRPMVPSRPEETETAAFFEAVEVLRTWNSSGRAMDDGRRGEAMEALEALDLSLMFHKAIVDGLAEHERHVEDALRLDVFISIFETAVERLIVEHLPYVRRFAARNVEPGEDPEDVFQVSFMGLLRSIRRFDPEYGRRFVAYSAFWMKHTLMFWRANERATVRVPVYRHPKLADLDRASKRLEARRGRSPTTSELESELGWDRATVRLFLQIPRLCSDPENPERREEFVTDPDQERALDRIDAARIVSETLAELTDRQAAVLRMRYGVECDDEMTLEDIGRVYGLTRERIRQIEAKGLERLSHPGRRRRIQALLNV